MKQDYFINFKVYAHTHKQQKCFATLFTVVSINIMSAFCLFL